jgi:HlyD family secretion protein
MNNRRILYLIGLFFIIFGGIYYSVRKEGESNTLRLHGWVEGTEVTVSSEVSGKIIDLRIEEGDLVKKGDLIAVIKSDQIRAKLEYAEAQIKASKEHLDEAIKNINILKREVEGAKISLELIKKRSSSMIREARAALKSAEANLSRAKANLKKAKKDYNRFLPLNKKGVVSSYKLDELKTAYEVASAELERSEEEIRRAKANLDLAEATKVEIRLKENDLKTYLAKLSVAQSNEAKARAKLEAAEAEKKEIEANFRDTYIYNPVTGSVIDKLVEFGELVVHGTPMAVIVDLNDLYVKSYVSERDIAKIRLGERANIYVDSFPDRYFKAKVIYISDRAEFTPKDVQMEDNRTKLVYKIKIGIENPQGFLKPGIPADAELFLWKEG